MTFLGIFKKNQFAYAILLSLGLTILFINNTLQFLDYTKNNKFIILTSILIFIVILLIIAYHKEEVLK